MLKLTRGNLLQAPVEALVNTVNTQGVMGKGIALQFKRAFPDNFKAYAAESKAGRVQPGEMFVFQRQALHGPRWIINFPTKRHWRQPSRLEDIDAGLVALAKAIEGRGIRSVAVPPLGCGNGGLEWSVVRPRIEAALARLGEVEVLLFEPSGAPSLDRMAVATKPPKMTSARAALIALMSRYRVPGYDYPLSLLEVQKLAYFLQQAGAPLRLKFVRHHYGPYADNLRHVLNDVEGHFLRGYGDGQNQPTTVMEVLPGIAEQAEQALAGDADVQRRFETVAKLIEGFETPLGMELLATVHWVAVHDEEARTDGAVATRAVQEWNTRKAKVMKPPHVMAAWARLREQHWI